MAWNTLTNLADQQVVTEEHMDDIRENIEHLGSLKAWGRPLSSLNGSDEMVAVTGEYTGDGTATQSINVGFQPKMVIVYTQASAVTSLLAVKTDQDGTGAYNLSNGFATDHIISLDANGFTVGDGTGTSNQYNVNTRLYTYIAFGAG
ncbi:MAG: hypothetical protein K8I82_23095 [Anaerolineae bacterium]|nr:hypothetical protein [Anaerolineae bacterium]